MFAKTALRCLMLLCGIALTIVTAPTQAATATARSADLINLPLFIVDSDGNSPSGDDTLLHEIRTQAPIVAPDGHQLTLAEWNAVRGEVEIECFPEGTQVTFDVTGLIPNGVYTAWGVTFKQPGFVTPTFEGLFDNLIGLGCVGTPDGTESIFHASDVGEGRITAIIPAGRLSMLGDIAPCALTDEYEFHVVGSYHIDGQTYGPDLGPDGTAVEQFGWLFKQNLDPTPVEAKGKLTTTWAQVKQQR